MRAGRIAAAVALSLAAWGCAEEEAPPERETFPAGPDGVRLARLAPAELPGWDSDRVERALPALKRACGTLLDKPAGTELGPEGLAGTAGQWRVPCSAIQALEPGDGEALRKLVREQFAAFAVHGPGGPKGTFTGYYTATLEAAREPHGPYQYPLHRPPADLVRAPLARFDGGLPDRTLMGRVENGRFVPYYTRREINNGALAGRDTAFLWAKSRVDAFLLHIQGSGIAKLPSGERQAIGYAASNGRAFTGIGGHLLDKGLIEPSQASMQGVRRWLRNNPRRGAKAMNANKRYIFFQPRDGPAAVGTLGTPLTAGRSLAIDRARLPLGAPVWVATEHPTREAPIRRLMVAQDTGKAIKGTVRGDIYFGEGEAALAKAGRMKAPGRTWLLLPRAVAAELS